MKRKRLFTKRQQKWLSVPTFFLILLTSGCQSDGHTENVPAAADIQEETSQQYHSDLSSEDCFLCGESKGTALPLYRGQENIGIIDLNTFDLAPVTINLYDDFGKLIEKPENGSSTHITRTGENGFFLVVSADTNRGYAHGHLSFDKEAMLDIDQAASYLCADCLNRMMDNCWSDTPLNMGVIDFSTREIRLFEEKIQAFTMNDYYISCENRIADEEGTRNIDLLIFYCPERYQD